MPMKDMAIMRLNLPRTAVHHMPPDRLRELSASEIASVTQELMK
jgi:hypothetical protein